MPAALLLLLILLGPTASAAFDADGWHELPTADGGTLAFKLGLPADHDPDRSYPALLALPPGPQTREMVEASWTRYWGEQARRRGWIVISPAAPEGQRFHEGGERLLPELLTWLHAHHRVEHGRVHLAGASNGGRSAFRAATLWPHAFLSLTVLPGHPPTDADVERLPRLADLPVRLYVGGDDGDWVTRTERTAAQLAALGVDVSATVLPGEGHVPPSLDGEPILEHLDGLRRSSAASSGAIASAGATTTVFVVRHTDREGHADQLSAAGHERAAALARLLEPTGLDAIYASEYQRTQHTVAPTAAAQGVEARVLPAREDWAAHLLAEHVGQTVLVAGHSNTVPLVLAGLGVTRPVTLDEDDYGDLFVVRVDADGTDLLQLRF